MLSGKWTYRSFHDEPGFVAGDSRKALGLIFGEGVFDFSEAGADRFRGTLDMGGGYVLDLDGEICRQGDRHQAYRIVGEGLPGSPTEGWRYDYQCARGYCWPNGVEQVPSLLGTVIRVKAHGPKSPAGVTASFIAVSQAAKA